MILKMLLCDMKMIEKRIIKNSVFLEPKQPLQEEPLIMKMRELLYIRVLSMMVWESYFSERYNKNYALNPLDYQT